MGSARAAVEDALILRAYADLSAGGVPPTIREVAAAVGLSRSGVHYRRGRLIAAGYLRVGDVKTERTTVLTDKGRERIWRPVDPAVQT